MSDIAIATREGTDAVMLSGETAYGKFPFKAVHVMSTVAQRTESAMLRFSVSAPHLCSAHGRHMAGAVCQLAIISNLRIACRCSQTGLRPLANRSRILPLDIFCLQCAFLMAYDVIFSLIQHRRRSSTACRYKPPKPLVGLLKHEAREHIDYDSCADAGHKEVWQ